MIHLPASVRVYLCLTPCDMRKSLAPARKHKQVSGEGVQLQVLPDQRMQAVEAQEGTYAVPYGGGAERRREITAQELGALLSGIDLSAAKRRKRYRRAGL